MTCNMLNNILCFFHLADLDQTLANRKQLRTIATIMEFHLPEYFLGDLVATAAFGVAAILLIVFGYVTFDKLTPKLDFNDLIARGNLAMAVVVGSFILGLCYVVGRVVSAILGSAS